MNIEFEKPLVQNFIRTDKGVFAINALSEKEINKYIKYWGNCLKEKRLKLIELSNKVK